MSTIVFDIETIGQDWESLDGETQDYLLKYCKDDEEREMTKAMLGFHPLTGEVVAIGMYDPDKDIRSVYFQAPNVELAQHYESEGTHFLVGTEKEILEMFWKTIVKYNTYVTFNGREFDNPYIMMRSAVNKVATKRNLVPYRYSTKEHIDLLDQLTFYGATRKFNLDYFCKRFGVVSPKSEGVTGLMVPEMFANGECEEIAKYCIRDVVATGELYKIWNEYLRFE
jgi:DNA polymerase elongation subunit (family B)